MITLSKNNFAPYTDLHDVTTRVVIYDGILEDIPASYSPKELYLPICVSLYDLTKKFYRNFSLRMLGEKCHRDEE